MPTINVFGGNVVFGDAATINIASGMITSFILTEYISLLRPVSLRPKSNFEHVMRHTYLQ